MIGKDRTLRNSRKQVILSTLFVCLIRLEKSFHTSSETILRVRADNQGHRIDYFLASRSFTPKITKAEIIKDCTVSTNNPILLEINY